MTGPSAFPFEEDFEWELPQDLRLPTAWEVDHPFPRVAPGSETPTPTWALTRWATLIRAALTLATAVVVAWLLGRIR